MGGWGWVVGSTGNKANSAPLELGLGLSLAKSKIGVKTVVKTKAKEFALLELLHKKRKLDRLQYNELKLQDYYKLPGVNISELRDAFKFRVRMAEFGQNLEVMKNLLVVHYVPAILTTKICFSNAQA